MTGDARTMDELSALLCELDVEATEHVPVVQVVLEDGRSLDVFRAERVRERPIVWRLRGFVGDIRPREFVVLVLGTTDGRAIVTAGPGGDVVAASQAVVGARRTTRRLADLAELIAARVRRRFAGTDGSGQPSG